MAPPVGIPDFTWRQFSRLYARPSDIDIFPAGLAEAPQERVRIYYY